MIDETKFEDTQNFDACCCAHHIWLELELHATDGWWYIMKLWFAWNMQKHN